MGDCRRDPPQVGRFRGEDPVYEYDFGQWPMVLAIGWCGRFEPCQRARADAQAAHVGPRAETAGTATPKATAEDGTPRGQR